VLVCDDCDVEGTVEGVLAAGFIASGQTCVTGSRIIVQEGVYEEVVERLVRRTGELKVGRPWDGDTDIGAVIDGKAVERCQWFVDTARKEGASVLAGGEALKVDGKVCPLFLWRLISRGISFNRRCWEIVFRNIRLYNVRYSVR